MFPSAAELERSFELLSCYTDPAVLRDPDRLLGPPDKPLELSAVARTPIAAGTERHLTFSSPYQPIHGVYAPEYRNSPALHTGHVHAWQHARPGCGSLILVHGWGLGPVRLAKLEFGIDYFFRTLGLDVYYYVLPFHGARKPAHAKFGGELFPSANLMRTNEAFIQTTRELRGLIGWVQQRNAAPIGIMGSSLGGYTSALLASIDDRLDFAVPVLPPASMAELLWDQGKADPMRARAEAIGMTRERFVGAWALHSPMSHQPKVPVGGRMIVSATGDTLVPPRFVDPLWRHWGEPEHVRFAGGHILQLFRRHYHRRVGRMLARLGMVDARRLEAKPRGRAKHAPL